MSSVADDVLVRIQALESQPGTPTIRLTSEEIAAFGRKFMPDVKIEDVRHCGIVRIEDQDDPSTWFVDAPLPVKDVNPANDLLRHRMAVANARKAGDQIPLPTAYEQRLLDAEAARIDLRTVKRDNGQAPLQQVPGGAELQRAAIEQAKRELRAEALANKRRRSKRAANKKRAKRKIKR